MSSEILKSMLYIKYINELDEISKLDIDPYYRIIIIQKRIEDLREDKRFEKYEKTQDEQEKKTEKNLETKRGKTPYVVKWILENNISSFSIEDFYKEHPKHKKREKVLQQQITRLIEKKALYQMDKNKFEVDIECLKNLYLW